MRIMATIPVEKNILEDLLKSKLSNISQRIPHILEKSHYSDFQKFMDDARSGVLDEAEMDAISISNLLDSRLQYLKYQAEWRIMS